MTKIINVACTANQGRSPPGEVILRESLQLEGLLNIYDVISSGTDVDAIKQGDLSTAFMIGIISQAKYRGDVYTPRDLAKIDNAIQSEDEMIIKGLYETAVAKFGEEEHQYRAEVLPELGIEGQLKETQDQLVARPDVVAVFPMARRNAQRAEEIHQAAGYELSPEQPEIGSRWVQGDSRVLIAVPTAYATGNPDFEVPNAFGGTKADYKAGIEALVEFLPQAADKYLREEA